MSQVRDASCDSPLIETRNDGGPLSTMGRGEKDAPLPWTDWICPECKQLNFSKRSSCYRCGVLRTAEALPARRAGDAAKSSTASSASASETKRCGQ